MRNSSFIILVLVLIFASIVLWSGFATDNNTIVVRSANNNICAWQAAYKNSPPIVVSSETKNKENTILNNNDSSIVSFVDNSKLIYPDGSSVEEEYSSAGQAQEESNNSRNENTVPAYQIQNKQETNNQQEHNNNLFGSTTKVPTVVTEPNCPGLFNNTEWLANQTTTVRQKEQKFGGIFCTPVSIVCKHGTLRYGTPDSYQASIGETTLVASCEKQEPTTLPCDFHYIDQSNGDIQIAHGDAVVYYYENSVNGDYSCDDAQAYASCNNGKMSATRGYAKCTTQLFY